MESEREQARRRMQRRNVFTYLWREWTVERRRSLAPASAKPKPEAWSDDHLTAAWLGHSTVLINFFGIWVITDPVLSARIGVRVPFLTIGPKRLTAPALIAAELPPIDLIILSHAHFDHIDRRTLKQLPKTAQVVTAHATRDLLRGIRFNQVIELDWGESIRLTLRGMPIELRAFRAQHWGARLRYDEHRRYNSYVLARNGRRIIYAATPP